VETTWHLICNWQVERSTIQPTRLAANIVRSQIQTCTWQLSLFTMMNAGAISAWCGHTWPSTSSRHCSSTGLRGFVEVQVYLKRQPGFSRPVRSSNGKKSKCNRNVKRTRKIETVDRFYLVKKFSFLAQMEIRERQSYPFIHQRACNSHITPFFAYWWHLAIVSVTNYRQGPFGDRGVGGFDSSLGMRYYWNFRVGVFANGRMFIVLRKFGSSWIVGDEAHALTPGKQSGRPFLCLFEACSRRLSF